MMLNARMIAVGVLLAWLGGYAVLRMSWVTYPGLALERRAVKPDDRPLLMIPTGCEWTSTEFRPLLY